MRADIIAAATRVFSERGYHAASMAEIADALGMRKPSLYHHVRKKEDLLFAIHEQLIDELIDETMSVCSTSDDPVREAPRPAARRACASSPATATASPSSCRSAAPSAASAGTTLVVKRDFYERMVSRIIADGIAAGDFVDLPPDDRRQGRPRRWPTGATPGSSRTAALSADEVAETFATIVLSRARAPLT